jgi:hypothetical protein
MAVQEVRDYLEKEGIDLMSWQGNPEIEPSIWFVGKTRRPEWVVVRSAKFPSTKDDCPTNWAVVADGCTKLSVPSISLRSLLSASTGLLSPVRRCLSPCGLCTGCKFALTD